jgi:methane monooxygenase PmoA-like
MRIAVARIFGPLVLFTWSLVVSPAVGAEPITVEIGAWAAARKGTPVRWKAPDGLALPAAWMLVSAEGGKEVTVQGEAGRDGSVFFLLDRDLKTGEKRRYRIEPAAQSAAQARAECADLGGKHLVLRAGGKDVLRYNNAVVEPPTGIEPVFARSGYIHPVWTPSGLVISNDFPANHKHHHGIWMPWTKAEFEGREVNFWEQGYGLGKVECTALDEKVSGPVFGGFRARHRFLDLKAPGGPKPVLDETWELKVYAVDRQFLADFTSIQSTAGESPLLLKEYRYGGFGFRGAAEWEGKEGVEFLTSEGKTRANGHATRARWCLLRGKVGGKPCAIGFLCHPSNFRFPQRMRIHDTEPFFNFTPCQVGDFAIERGKPFVSRYRIVVADGALEPEEMESLWLEYAEPPRVEVVKS